MISFIYAHQITTKVTKNELFGTTSSEEIAKRNTGKCTRPDPEPCTSHLAVTRTKLGYLYWRRLGRKHMVIILLLTVVLQGTRFLLNGEVDPD
jgi:hypothetical protein